MVKGPLAATVAYLLDLGWQPRDSDAWLDTRGARHTMYTPQQECRVLDLLQQTYQEEVDRRIATGLAAPELKGGIDWTVGRKLLGGFKKEGRNTKASGLRCVWQGALVCSQNSAVKVCPRCHQEADWEHVLLDCARWEAQNWELPAWFQEGRAQGPRSLWTRGLPPQPDWQVPPPQEDKPTFLGIWASQEALSDPELVYGTDASGGPFTADPRLRQVAYAVVACKKQGQDYVQVGAIVGQVPGPQTVFRGEMYAVLQLARYTEGPVDTTLDCLGVPKRVRSPKPGKTHGDIWWELQATDVDRLKMKWVPSDLADALCGEKAAELARPEARAASQYQDHCSKKAQEFLASRAEKILTAVGENQHPVYKIFLQDKQARKHPEANARPCKKRVGSNIGRGHTTTQQEWFQELVRTKSIHAWEWDGLNLRCAQCQLKLLHTKNRKTLEALAAHQCAHQGRVAVEGVHVTHVLKLLGTRQLWVCEGCGGQLSLKTRTVSQKLAAACCFKKDSRCKSQFKPETTNPIRRFFQPAQAAKPEEGPNPPVRNGGNEAGGPALPGGPGSPSEE